MARIFSPADFETDAGVWFDGREGNLMAAGIVWTPEEMARYDAVAAMIARVDAYYARQRSIEDLIRPRFAFPSRATVTWREALADQGRSEYDKWLEDQQERPQVREYQTRDAHIQTCLAAATAAAGDARLQACLGASA